MTTTTCPGCHGAGTEMSGTTHAGLAEHLACDECGPDCPQDCGCRVDDAAEHHEFVAPRHPGATQSPDGSPRAAEGLRGAESAVSDAEAAEWAALADAVTEGSWHFIALARTAVPRLLADRERLTGEASRVPVLLADKAALMGDVDRLTAERDGARLMRVIVTRAFETTRRVLQEASGLPDDIDDPDCRDEMVLALRPRAEKAEAEVERLRETVTRLNRRAQIAESAINDLTREPIGGREHAPVAAEVWARCEETHGLVCRAAREARAEVSSLRTLLDPDGKATERLLEVADASLDRLRDICETRFGATEGGEPR